MSTPTPLLASTLFTHAQTSNPRTFTTSIKPLDRDLAPSPFTTGRLIGVSGVGDLHDRALRLVYETVATYLLETRDGRDRDRDRGHAVAVGKTASGPGVFIVEPATVPAPESALLGVYDLMGARIRRGRGGRGVHDGNGNGNVDVDVDELLGPVSVLPYFDLIGLSQALSEIMDSLGSSGEGVGVTVTATATATDESTGTDGTQVAERRDVVGSNTIVFVRGLGQTVHALLSRTSLARTAALLSEVLRQLRRLGKGMGRAPGVMVVLELGVGEGKAYREDGGGIDVGSVRSAFSSSDGREMRFRLMDDGGGYGQVGRSMDWKGSAAEVVAGLVEGSVDAMVVVHGGFGIVGGSRNEQCIVEVVKDRAGGSMGTWAVWEVRD